MNCILIGISQYALLAWPDTTGGLSWPFMASFRSTTTNDLETTRTRCFATSERSHNTYTHHHGRSQGTTHNSSQHLIILHMPCCCHCFTVAHKASVGSDEMLQSRPWRLCACLIDGTVKRVHSFRQLSQPERLASWDQNKEIASEDINEIHAILKPVGGFNPSEKYARQIGSSPQVGVNMKNFWVATT